MHGFFHVYADGEWEQPLHDFLTVYTFDFPMTYGIVGAPKAREAVIELLDDPDRIEADHGFEQVTLRELARRLPTLDGPVFYGHTKGASDPSLFNGVWRRVMLRCCVAEWESCVKAISTGYDAVGAHWLRPEEWPRMDVRSPFFGGNFWWASTDYLKRLPPVSDETRHQAERWIGLSKPKALDLCPGWPGWIPWFRGGMFPLGF